MLDFVFECYLHIIAPVVESVSAAGAILIQLSSTIDHFIYAFVAMILSLSILTFMRLAKVDAAQRVCMLQLLFDEYFYSNRSIVTCHCDRVQTQYCYVSDFSAKLGLERIQALPQISLREDNKVFLRVFI